MDGLGAAALGSLILGDVSSASAQYGAIQAEQSQVLLESRQQEVAFSQKSLNTIANTKKLLEQQAVSISSAGGSLGSGSFKAISQDTFDKGSQTEANEDRQTKIAEASFKAKKAALSQQENALPWQMMGRFINQAASIGSEFL